MRYLYKYTRLVVQILAITGWSLSSESIDIPAVNITVPYGSDVNLTCVSEESHHLYARWDKEDNGYILAIETHVIVDDPRISVDLADNTTWILNIQKVQAEDRGSYRCTVNSTPIAMQRVYLEVLDVPVPPSIVVSPVDVRVREKSTIALTCYAAGHPKPLITWSRDDGKPIHMWINHTLPFTIGIKDSRWESHSTMSFEGETLRLSRISRKDAGSYRCTANNSVDPTASEVTHLDVVYPPAVVYVRGPREAKPYEKVTFSCRALNSNPPTEISWIVEGHPKHAVSASKKMSSGDAGYDSTSILSFIVPSDAKGEMMVTCLAVNEEIGAKEVESYLLRIKERDKSDPLVPPKLHASTKVPSGRHHTQLVPAMMGGDINPKRGQENSVYPPRKKSPDPPVKTAYYNLLVFLRFFGLLMHFH